MKSGSSLSHPFPTTKYPNPTTTKVNYYTCLAMQWRPFPKLCALAICGLTICPWGVRSNISKARRQFFALGSSGCFLGFSNPLSAREVVETCMIPTLLYGAENWILDEACLELMESFRAEIGRRILKVSKFHSQLSVRICLFWPSITSRILKQKLSFLCRLLTSDDDSIATRTFVSQNAYNLSLVKQCIFLDSKLKTNFTALILSDIGSASASLKVMKKFISSIDRQLMLEEAGQHQSVCLAREVKWLRVWEAATSHSHFLKLLTMPLFEDRRCRMCDGSIPEDTNFFTHLSQDHTPSSFDIENLLVNLSSQCSDPSILHEVSCLCMYTSLHLHCQSLTYYPLHCWAKYINFEL